MKVLILSVFLTCSGLYYFMNEYYWKKTNPEGFAKSKDEAALILKAKRSKNKEVTKSAALETLSTHAVILRIN